MDFCETSSEDESSSSQPSERDYYESVDATDQNCIHLHPKESLNTGRKVAHRFTPGLISKRNRSSSITSLSEVDLDVMELWINTDHSQDALDTSTTLSPSAPPKSLWIEEELLHHLFNKLNNNSIIYMKINAFIRQQQLSVIKYTSIPYFIALSLVVIYSNNQQQDTSPSLPSQESEHEHEDGIRWLQQPYDGTGIVREFCDATYVRHISSPTIEILYFVNKNNIENILFNNLNAPLNKN